jgi:hypothetical protein
MAVGARANAYNFAVTFFVGIGSFTYGYCIRPAFARYKRADIDSGCPISDAIVTNNFRGKGEQTVQVPILKAIVAVPGD